MSLSPYLSAYYSGAQTWLNANANFADYPVPYETAVLPTAWSVNSGSTPLKQPGTVSANQALITGGAGDQCILQSNFVQVVSPGWYILEAEAGLQSGTLSGAGLQVNVTDAGGGFTDTAAIIFESDPDVTGTVRGDGVAGQTYRWRKLVQFQTPASIQAQVFPCAHYSNLGSIAAANAIGFDLAGLRPASPAEVAAGNQYPAGLPVFPLLPGLDPEIDKAANWSTGVATAASGVERRTPYWSYPKWDFALKYEVLRDRPQLLLDESKAILELFNTVRGKYGVFQFLDQDDYQVVNETTALGDGSATTFQLYRHIRSWFEPVLCPFGVVMFVNGAVSAFTLGANGQVTFASPPASGAVISWTGGFFYPCRFDQDDLTLKRIAYQLWSNEGLKFVSVKTLS